jgi:NADPH-dependent 2,4-dienoyl-CoA reductase/sulfur reductase-like enzyme
VVGDDVELECHHFSVSALQPRTQSSKIIVMRSPAEFSFLPLLLASFPGHVSAKVIETEVVVVGGGISGLAAANTLKDGGFKDITVLEAKETIGGRIRSIQRKTGPGIIELGATWINNKTQPQIYALTEAYGLETAVQWYEGDLINEDLEGNIHRIDKEVDTNASHLSDFTKYVH